MVEYSEIRLYFDGLAAVCAIRNKEPRWGFINLLGEEQIECKYNTVTDFSNGLSKVTCNVPPFIKIEETFNIDTKGNREFLIQDRKVYLKYDLVIKFSKYCSIVEHKRRMGIIDNDGNEVQPCIYGNIGGNHHDFTHTDSWHDPLKNKFVYAWTGPIPTIKETCGLINEFGQLVIPCEYYNIWLIQFPYFKIENFKHSAMNGQYWGRKNYGVYDIEKQFEIVPCQYNSVEFEINGLSKVILNGKEGYINENGLLLFKRGSIQSYVNYDMIYDRVDGFFTCCKSEKKGVIDCNENIIVPCKYYSISEFENDLAIISVLFEHFENYDFKQNEWIYEDKYKYGIIDNKGHEVVPCEFDEILPFTCGLSRFKENNKFGFFNNKGEVVLTPDFIVATQFINNLAVIRINDKNLIINQYGESQILKTYDYISFLNDTLFNVGIKGKFGIIDGREKTILETNFDSISDFSIYGTSVVRRNGKYGIVDTKGQIVIPMDYESLENFNDELAAFSLGTNYGFINLKNEVVIPPIYTWVRNFENGFAEVAVLNNVGDQECWKNYVIDTKGNFVSNIYEEDNESSFQF